MRFFFILIWLMLSLNTFGEEKKMVTVNGKKINQEWIDYVQEKNKKIQKLLMHS